DRRAGSKSIPRSSTKDCGCEPNIPALNSTNSTRRVTLHNSRPRPNTSLTASKTDWTRSRREKKARATCATSARSTGQQESGSRKADERFSRFLADRRKIFYSKELLVSDSYRRR